MHTTTDVKESLYAAAAAPVWLLFLSAMIFGYFFWTTVRPFSFTLQVSEGGRGELSYLAPLGSENFTAPYFKQCFFQRGITHSDSQTPRLPVPRQK